MSQQESPRARAILGALALALILAPPSAAQGAPPAQPGPWLSLQSPEQWRGYRRDELPEGWAFDAATGVLTRLRGAGDIITRRQFENFELELEWKVGPRGNSGIFYRATEGTRRIYENAPEMQVLDNTGHADGRNSLTSAGANYGLHAPARDLTKPVGEWNAVRLVVRGAHVEHWLNGEKVVEYELWTDDWKAKVKASKFNEWPAYGWATRGHIGLQDHGDVVAFREMRIRELAP